MGIVIQFIHAPNDDYMNVVIRISGYLNGRNIGQKGLFIFKE